MNPANAPDTLCYDGACGLCHRAVKFVRKRDRDGERFRLAPFQGKTPDSLVLRTGGGALLTRSSACIYILRRLGGPWRIAAALLAAVPRPLRDAAYNLVARTRGRWGGPPVT